MGRPRKYKSDDEANAARREYLRNYMANRRSGNIGSSKINKPTDEALEEVKQLMMTERPITALLMGDPLPGRSALDKIR